MKQISFVLTLSLLAAGVLVGCGNNKRLESTEVPKQAPSNEPAPAVKAAPVASDHYTVRKNDTLWAIAGKDSTYSDSFQWPLIYKANRDTIKDPDLIYPRQDFMILKGVEADEVAHARKTAMETPKYVPHTEPRQTLPVDYF